MSERKERKEKREPEERVQGEMELAMLVIQVLEALAQFQAKSDEPVSVLVPTGRAEQVKGLDLERAFQQAQLPILRELSLQDLHRLAELWRAIIQRVPIVESDEVQQIVIVTLSMDLISRLHERYTQMGLSELVQKRGIAFDLLAVSNLYPQLLLTLFALDIYTEMVSRAPKLVIPTTGFVPPAGNA